MSTGQGAMKVSTSKWVHVCRHVTLTEIYGPFRACQTKMRHGISILLPHKIPTAKTNELKERHKKSKEIVYLPSNSLFILISRKQFNQQVTTVTTTAMYSLLENDTDFYDDFQDISSGEKRIVRVGTKSFDKMGTYITIKLYKKIEDVVFKCY